MTTNDLRREIAIELELIETVLQELSKLREDVADRESTVRERTAAAAFMAQFYGGIENILKRISHFYNIPLPTGDTWHIDLFKRYCSSAYALLPVLFDEHLALEIAPFRKFRHVVHHGYGFQLDWKRMKEGLENIGDVYSKFKANLLNYMKKIE